MSAADNPHDYVFRYRLGEGPPRRPGHHDKLVELLRANLEDLLALLVPMQGDNEVKIDGFKLLSDTEATYSIYPPIAVRPQPGEAPPSAPEAPPPPVSYQSTRNAQLYEPRIDFIKRRLEGLLEVIELEKEGREAPVDGFRLKDLRHWLVPSSGEPIEVFGYLANRCNCDCIFCCLKGNPPDFPLAHPRRSAGEEYEEIKTRTRYLPERRGQALFTSLGGIYEVLAHPHCLETLAELRRKTDKPFRITTNGEALTPELITGLAALQPVYLYYSLISSSPRRRARLMRSRRPEAAIAALPLLRQAGIPFTVVIVAWPVESREEMLADMESTIAFAQEHGAHLVQVNLPGYSGCFTGEGRFDLPELWTATVRRVRELRSRFECPIVVMPALYEEGLFEPHKNLPRAIGVVRSSPAALAGVRGGDMILEINGLPVRSRPQARDILSVVRGSGGKASITVQRGERNLRLELDTQAGAYPYSPATDNHLGVIFMGAGLRLSYVEDLKKLIDSHKARRVLFLSSTLVRPLFEQLLAESRLFNNPEIRLDIRVPQNGFFGGNIFMGDLLVVQDFIDAIRRYREETGTTPDLVVVPSSPFNLGPWRRDLTGRPYLDIERESGVRVALLECATIYE